MNEHDQPEPSLGISRRTLLRRGAVVGGTLMWTAPMVRSLTPAAFGAEMGPSPGVHACCACFDPVDPSNPISGDCNANGFRADVGRMSRDNCQNYCRDLGYKQYHYQTSETTCACQADNEGCKCPNPIVDVTGFTGA